jgi:hypothetical protein
MLLLVLQGRAFDARDAAEKKQGPQARRAKPDGNAGRGICGLRQEARAVFFSMPGE